MRRENPTLFLFMLEVLYYWQYPNEVGKVGIGPCHLCPTLVSAYYIVSCVKDYSTLLGPEGLMLLCKMQPDIMSGDLDVAKSRLGKVKAHTSARRSTAVANGCRTVALVALGAAAHSIWCHTKQAAGRVDVF